MLHMLFCFAKVPRTYICFQIFKKLGMEMEMDLLISPENKRALKCYSAINLLSSLFSIQSSFYNLCINFVWTLFLCFKLALKFHSVCFFHILFYGYFLTIGIGISSSFQLWPKMLPRTFYYQTICEFLWNAYLGAK